MNIPKLTPIFGILILGWIGLNMFNGPTAKRQELNTRIEAVKQDLPNKYEQQKLLFDKIEDETFPFRRCLADNKDRIDKVTDDCIARKLGKYDIDIKRKYVIKVGERCTENTTIAFCGA